MSRWGGLLDCVEERVEQVRSLMGAIVESTSAIGDTIDAFFDWRLDRLPFGRCGNLREASDSV